MPTLKETKDELEAKRLRRQAFLEAAEEYTSFATTKTAGVGLVTAGSLELLSPEVIHAVLPDPAGMLGVGFALLAGRKAAKLLAKVINSFD